MRRYRLSWRTFEGPIKAILRFYCSHTDAMPDEMGTASFSAWCACESAFQELTDSERETVMDSFGDENWQQNQKISAQHQSAIVRKVCRLVAENMGLCDKEA